MNNTKSIPKKIFQRPIRISAELEAKINRAKGGYMVQTGKATSNNDFIIRLIELGLKAMTNSKPD